MTRVGVRVRVRVRVRNVTSNYALRGGDVSG